MRQETIRIPERLLWEIYEVYHRLDQELIQKRKPLRITRALVFRAAIAAGLRGENIRRMDLSRFIAFCRECGIL